MTIEELHKLWDKKNNGKAANSEHDLQCQFVRWFRYKHPHLPFYAVPNGGLRPKTTARKLKAEGQTAGVPDIHIPVGRNGFLSLYIEWKNGKQGRLSDSQKHMIALLELHKNKVAVCRTLEEGIKVVEEYLNTNNNENKNFGRDT